MAWDHLAPGHLQPPWRLVGDNQGYHQSNITGFLEAFQLRSRDDQGPFPDLDRCVTRPVSSISKHVRYLGYIVLAHIRLDLTSPENAVSDEGLSDETRYCCETEMVSYWYYFNRALTTGLYLICYRLGDPWVKKVVPADDNFKGDVLNENL